MRETAEMLRLLNDIKQKIETGELTAERAEKRIQGEIERELSKPAEKIDMAFVDACETFLMTLGGKETDSHYSDNLRAVRGQLRKKAEQKRMPRMGKFAATACAMAAILAVITLMPGGVIDVLGLAGNDHTRRLEEMQEPQSGMWLRRNHPDVQQMWSEQSR